MSSFTPILPPFPFPERWAEVSMVQCQTGSKKWLVPGTLTEIDVSSVTLTGAVPGAEVLSEEIQREYLLSNDSDCNHDVSFHPTDFCWNTDDNGEEVEGFELDPIWAARFSKTIKRMKQKVHKAKRRAEWKKK